MDKQTFMDSNEFCKKALSNKLEITNDLTNAILAIAFELAVLIELVSNFQGEQ